MAEYTELIKALRECGERFFCDGCPIFETCDGDVDRAMHDAADAIEALQAQLPKRGNIVRCGECKWYGIYYAKKDGTPDKRYSPSVCLRGKYAKRRDPDWFCADGERKVQE